MLVRNLSSGYFVIKIHLVVSLEGVFQFEEFSENEKPIACLARTSGVLDKQYLDKKFDNRKYFTLTLQFSCSVLRYELVVRDYCFKTFSTFYLKKKNCKHWFDRLYLYRCIYCFLFYRSNRICQILSNETFISIKKYVYKFGSRDFLSLAIRLLKINVSFPFYLRFVC